MFSKISLFVLIALSFFVQSAEAQRVRLQAKMGAKDQVQAAAKYESRGNRQKFNVEVEDGISNANYRVIVRRGGTMIYSGQLRTNQFGFGEIDIDNTEGDSVPTMQERDTVVIRDPNRGALRGALRRR